MPVTQIPIANGFYLSDSLPISAQECVNWFPNVPQTAAVSAENLFGVPGKVLATSTGIVSTDFNRGSYHIGPTPYFVNNQTLYRVTQTITDGVATYAAESLGTIEGTTRVWMAENGTQLMILDPAGKGYIFTENPDTLTEITTSGFRDNGNPIGLVYIDGYFCCTTDDKKFIISGLNDGLSWDPLDFGTAESSPDKVVVPVKQSNELFICGEHTIEGFNNVGGAGFPFQRSGLFFDEGVFAPFSVINAPDTFVFIGGGEDETPAIWQLVGNSTKKISTTAIDNVLSGLTRAEVESIFAWRYASKGHFFAGFSLPDTTFVYDFITARWHERKSRIENPDGSVDITRDRINSITTGFNVVLVGDSQDGRIGILDGDDYQEYGSQIFRRAAAQALVNNMQAFTVPLIEIMVESGVGNELEPDPQIRMDRSIDGGKTYQDDRTRPLGKIGEYRRRAVWRRNGRADRFAIFRFTMTDPVKPVIAGVYADVRTMSRAGG